MSAEAWQLLALLLSSAGERSSFFGDRALWLSQHDIPEAESAWFLELDQAQTEKQAAALIRKRYSELHRLIPQSLASAGRGQTVFEQYTRTFWPDVHSTLEEDALRFLNYCQQHRHPIDHWELAFLKLKVSQTRLCLWLDRSSCFPYRIPTLVIRIGTRHLRLRFG